MIGGYDSTSDFPILYRLAIQDRTCEKVLSNESPFGIAFSGQTEHIERILFSADARCAEAYTAKVRATLCKFHDKVQECLTAQGVTLDIPHRDSLNAELHSILDLPPYVTDGEFAELSEQSVIDCVESLIEIGIRLQRIISRIPTVGGDVNIAAITSDGFRFRSPRKGKYRNQHSNRGA